MKVIKGEDIEKLMTHGSADDIKKSTYTSLALAEYLGKHHYTITQIVHNVKYSGDEATIPDDYITIDSSTRRDPDTRRISVYSEMNYKGFLLVLASVNGAANRVKAHKVYTAFMEELLED